MKKINAESISDGIQSEGFDYYMEHYGKSDLVGTKLENIYMDYISYRARMIQSLRDAGVNMDD